jgi:hypothetical protein
VFSPNTNEESQKEFKKSASFLVQLGNLNTESPMKHLSSADFDQETFDLTPPPLSTLIVPQDLYPPPP